MAPAPQPYQAQTFGADYNPWDPTTGDPTAGSTDPYAASISQAESQATNQASMYNAQAPSMQAGITQGQTAATNYQNSTAAYPSYPNVAGAGSQTAGQAPAMQGSGDQGAGYDMTADDTSHGFNPWSLQGEAMTRSP